MPPRKKKDVTNPDAEKVAKPVLTPAERKAKKVAQAEHKVEVAQRKLERCNKLQVELATALAYLEWVKSMPVDGEETEKVDTLDDDHYTDEEIENASSEPAYSY